MPASAELDNLVRTGQLKREPPVTSELSGLRDSGEKRLADAANPALALESRFDLAYNAAYADAVSVIRTAPSTRTGRHAHSAAAAG
jgi:hypothetical protein